MEEFPAGLDVMRSSRLDVGRHGQAQDLDEDGPLRADRPAAATAGLVVRRPVAAALHRLGVDDDHRGQRLAAVEEPDQAAEASHRPGPDPVRPPAPPLLPDRAPRRVPLGQVAPLAAGPGARKSIASTIDRRSIRAGAPRRLGGSNRSATIPLVVAKRDAEGHARTIDEARDTLPGANAAHSNTNIRTQALSLRVRLTRGPGESKVGSDQIGGGR